MNRRKRRIEKMGTTQLRQTKRRMIWTFLFIVGFCCVFTGMALAQVDQGSITGVVKDTKGAVVVGASVSLTNIDRSRQNGGPQWRHS